MPINLQPLLADLRSEQADVVGLTVGRDLRTATPAQGWDVRDTIAHLAGSDVEATRAMAQPAEFVAGLAAIAADVEAFLGKQLTDRYGCTPEQLLAQWQAGFAVLLLAFDQLAPEAAIPWYGPPMSPASFATARLMEYWAHGQDIADAFGVQREPTARLRHIAHLGFRTRGFSFAVRGLTPPAGAIRVVLAAPDGSTWEYGDPAATDAVHGSALDFCLLVTQRRHREDTALVASGPGSDAWLDVAQCFAGLPSAGRAKASR